VSLLEYFEFRKLVEDFDLLLSALFFFSSFEMAAFFINGCLLLATGAVADGLSDSTRVCLRIDNFFFLLRLLLSIFRSVEKYS
jgi:hypothetical protein